MDAMTQRLTQAPRPLRSAASDLSDDLITAVNGCLHPEPAKRWSDAKSLRSALAPMDDESDDGLPGRILRLGTVIFLLTLLVLAYEVIFTQLKPDLRMPDAFKRSVFGFSISGLAFLFIGSFQLKRQGMDARTILGKALQQPRWWRPWYPKRFRRRGDVWDRLPAPIRRFRIWWAVLIAYVFGFSLPMFFGLGFLHVLPAFRTAVEIGMFALIASLSILRKRSVKEMADSLKISRTEASKLVSAQTWRTSVWQRGPAATLLRDTKPTRTITPPKLEGEGDQATRI